MIFPVKLTKMVFQNNSDSDQLFAIWVTRFGHLLEDYNRNLNAKCIIDLMQM